jgi:hypothetical protein
VSVISDGGPEEEEVVVPRAESVCEEQELLELGEKGEAQYKHQPNPQLNLLLNAILVVAFASVSGLAVGHFLGVNIKHLGMDLELIGVFAGVQEECFAPPVAPVAWKQFNSLNLENDLLKMQLKQLQDCTIVLFHCAFWLNLWVLQLWLKNKTPGMRCKPPEIFMKSK